MPVMALPNRPALGPGVVWRAAARRPASSSPLRARQPLMGAAARPRRSPPRARRAPRVARLPPRPWAWAAASRRAARAAAPPPRRSRRGAASAPRRRAARPTCRSRTSRCQAGARVGPRAGRLTSARCSLTYSAAAAVAAAAVAAAGPAAARAAAWRACWGACCSRLPWASWSARWPAAREVRRLCFPAPHHTFCHTLVWRCVCLEGRRGAMAEDVAAAICVSIEACTGCGLCDSGHRSGPRASLFRRPHALPRAPRTFARPGPWRIVMPRMLTRQACPGASVARGGPGHARRAGEAGGGLGGMLSQLGQAPGAGAPGAGAPGAAGGGDFGALMQQMMPMVANVRPPSSLVPRCCPQDYNKYLTACVSAGSAAIARAVHRRQCTWLALFHTAANAVLRPHARSKRAWSSRASHVYRVCLRVSNVGYQAWSVLCM